MNMIARDLSTLSTVRFQPDARVHDAGAFSGRALIVHESGGVTRQLRGRDDWLLLGGHVLFQAREIHPTLAESEYQHTVSVVFHGGRKAWCLQHERWSQSRLLPCTLEVGRLEGVMLSFERVTGLSLPEVTILNLGSGVSHHSAQGARYQAGNPWGLRADTIYEITRRDGGNTNVLRYRSHAPVQPGGKVMVSQIMPDGSESERYDPGLIFAMRPVDLMTLRCNGELVFGGLADLVPKVVAQATTSRNRSPMRP